MNSTKFQKRLQYLLPRFGFLVPGMLLTALVAAAQPTPVGPPPNVTEDGAYSITTLQRFVRDIAQGMVSATNAELKADGEGTRVSIDSITSVAGWRSQTIAVNRPNSSYVVVPVRVKIKVAIPSGFDRRIVIPIDVKFFCDGWYAETGGTITAQGEAGSPWIEGGSSIESLLTIRDNIDRRVREEYRAPLPFFTSTGLRCSTIGYSKHATGTVLEDDVVWDIPRVIPKDIHSPVLFTDQPRVLVTFEKVKRLRARGFLPGTILYKEVEEVTFRGFANYSEVGKSFLSMREGDEVVLHLRTLDFKPQTYDKLVIIGNIEQPLGDNLKHTTFTTTARSINYSPGRHQMQIPKWFSHISGQTGKPLFYSVPAYEVTYTVRYIDPNLETHASQTPPGVWPMTKDVRDDLILLHTTLFDQSRWLPSQLD